MNPLRLCIFLLVALIQITVPASMIWKRHHTLRDGRAWKFRTAPVDPEDPFRGRYVALRFAAEQSAQPEEIAVHSSHSVYVRLKADPDGFAQVERVSEEPLSGDDVVRADAASYYEGKQHVTFPFDQYWLDETIARQADRAYEEHSRRGADNAYVIVRVRDGDAALEQLYIDGVPLREYLGRSSAAGETPNE